MTTISNTNNSAVNALNSPSKTNENSDPNALGQADFLRLLTVQLKQQDPLDPVDNKQMLSQMAQFSSLAGTTTTNATLSDISAKLDALIAVQQQAITPSTSTNS